MSSTAKYQMPRGIVVETSVRRAVAAASLVEHDDAVCLWVEKTAQTGRRTTPRSAVYNDNWFAHGIAALLVVNCVNVGNLEHARIICVNVRVQLQAVHRGLHVSAGSVNENA